MALDDIFKGGNIVNGLALAVGAAVLTPIVTPVVRPLAKSLIKAGLLAYDQGRVAMAQLNEHTGDIVAEAREELAHAKTEAAPGADAKVAATG
ncbi:DUF5132 domain-containing protein [Methylobacterium sp. P31]